MPEVIRLLAARIRHFVADRRSARRIEMRVRCTVGLASGRARSSRVLRDESLDGFTYDVSDTGLGLLMPAIHINGQYLTGAGNTLLILIELPEGPILLQGIAVRYERQESENAKLSYLVGVRITDINEKDHARFLKLLK